MLSISQGALLEGCERARDLFLLNRLQGPAPGGETVAAVFDALGIEGLLIGDSALPTDELDRPVARR